jgi:ParB-like chromosome segregation protein Spo0J
VKIPEMLGLIQKGKSLIKASISAFGQTKPVIADKNYVILAGHGFVKAAIELGLRPTRNKMVLKT